MRDLRVQPAFFHNGTFTRLDDAVRFHLNALAKAKHYSARRAGVKADLAQRLGPSSPYCSNSIQRWWDRYGATHPDHYARAGYRR